MRMMLAVAAAMIAGQCAGPATPKTSTVEYFLDGGGGTHGGTYVIDTPGGTEQGETSFPAAPLQEVGFRSGTAVSVVIQNVDGFGWVSCRMTINGQQVAENRSDGPYVIASCTAMVP